MSYQTSFNPGYIPPAAEPEPVHCCNITCYKTVVLGVLKWSSIFITPFIPVFIATGNGTIYHNKQCHLSTVVTVAYAICTLYSALHCAYAFKTWVCSREEASCNSRAIYPLASVAGLIIIVVEIIWYGTSCVKPTS